VPVSRKPKSTPVAPEVTGAQRELVAAWMKQKMRDLDEANRERIETLRTAGEHPSPIFSGMVRRFAGLGLSKTHVAKLIGASVGVINEHYGEDFEIGVAEVNATVAASMLSIATDPFNPAAGKVGMTWLDRRGGSEWAPATKKIEVENTTRQPPVIDSTKLTFEERQQLRIMLTRIANGGEGDPEEEPVIE
jgi:hypothetical protein